AYDILRCLVGAELCTRDRHKGQYARWENVQDLFVCISPGGLEGKHLLLVDDVLTTGATVVSCSDAFRDIPRLRISVLTLALAGET
ncbi:MAG: hypothetical protein K2P62_01505, partial [Phocaeicola sp.]|nr:hypothetical protein [Phocaeicola sp.]